MSPDAAVIEQIVNAATHAPPRLGETRLICVDGPAGAGKTTLSTALPDAFHNSGLGAVLLHMDDMYEDWDGLNPTLEPRLLDQVLLPLAAGVDARWQRYDWHREAFCEWVDLAPPEVLILEGCGSGALAYAEYISTLVWVEASPDTRVRRGLERDGDQVLPQWLRWMETERLHFELNKTRARADLGVQTDPPVSLDPSSAR